MRVRCTDIEWDTSDTDGEIPKLPKAVTITVPPLKEWEDQDCLTDELADALSDKTGFCVCGFNFHILRK